jgi:hypothetical protein
MRNQYRANDDKAKRVFLARPSKMGMEAAVALAGTAFAAILLIQKAMYAGPLWRDEVNTANVAQMPSLKELWSNMTFESFPPLWPLLLRVCGFLGLAGSDASIHVLGLYVGLFFLVSLWLCSRWIGSRAPILSIALLGSLPAFVFIVGSNRAYGLASGLLVLSFGMIWRMVELPSRSRILWAGLTCFLFAHCVYYDVVFLCAMLGGGILVAIRRRQWKTVWALAGIGVISGASMAVYLPIIHRGSAYVPMVRQPFFDSSALWHGFCDALAARSSAQSWTFNSSYAWLWVWILLFGFIVALVMQWTHGRQAQNPVATAVTTTNIRADLALFCVVSILLGSAGYVAFLLNLKYFIQPWYCVELFCLCAISLDGILGANWPVLRPWGLLRMGFMVVMVTWSARSAWEEAHTRRSNVDLIAYVLGKNASTGDLIVVQGAWEGITFNRYYHGQTAWMTIPPIDSHLVHRNDLVMEKMNQRDPMAPVLREITSTLQRGNSVWLVGNAPTPRPNPLPPSPPPLPPGLPTGWWLGGYLGNWIEQVETHLLSHALQEQVLEIPVGGPVSHFENLPVSRFSGYKPS